MYKNNPCTSMEFLSFSECLLAYEQGLRNNAELLITSCKESIDRKKPCGESTK